MKKKKRLCFLPKYHDRTLNFAMIGLLVFGSLMIVSASMGPIKGEYQTAAMVKVVAKQIVIIIFGLTGYFIVNNCDFFKWSRDTFNKVGLLMIIFLFGTLAFPSRGGAHAWYSFGPFTLQASEVVKIFDIVFIAKMLSINYATNDDSEHAFLWVAGLIVIYAIVIFIFEKDLGSAVILLGMAYLTLLVPRNRAFGKIQRIMVVLMFLGIVAILIVLSPTVINWLDSWGSSSYQIQRFVAAANPFEKRFDSGYHLVMSLVSFATGGLFGLGYGKSTHKYMNFPNPDSDFILPVIVEELGIVGFIIILILYGMLLFPMIKHAFSKYADDRSRMVLVGVSMYFILHFILNVGGVSGLIPLTGVPILLISYGGTQTLTSLCAIALAQKEIDRIRRKALKCA